MGPWGRRARIGAATHTHNGKRCDKHLARETTQLVGEIEKVRRRKRAWAYHTTEHELSEVLKGNLLAKDSARHTYLETAC